MTRALIVHKAGPSVSVQDLGRIGLIEYGLSRGGAADRMALYEGAALLGQSVELAAIEMAGFGGVFEATHDLRFALLGAKMRAEINGRKLAWNASHKLHAGEKLEIGAAISGVYGYLVIGGGIDTIPVLGSRSTQLNLGDRLQVGTHIVANMKLSLGADQGAQVAMALPQDQRFDGGQIRIVSSLQTHLFDDETLTRFQRTVFKRDGHGNRMGVRLTGDQVGFVTQHSLNILSEIVMPGDIQMTGDGTPFVLLCECQTTGGYPRIGSVIPTDLPKLVQAPAGASLQFEFISLDEALAIEAKTYQAQRQLRQDIYPLIRDPRNMTDLLSYQLISGVTMGDDLEREEDL